MIGGWVTSPVHFFQLKSFAVVTTTFHPYFFTLSHGERTLLFYFLLPTCGFPSLKNKLIDRAKSKTKLKTRETSYCINV